jgi:hypothetical protein
MSRRVAVARCPWCWKRAAEWWTTDHGLREVRSISDRQALADRPEPAVGVLAKMTWQWQRSTDGPAWCADPSGHRWEYDRRYRGRLQTAVADGRAIVIRLQRVAQQAE